MRKDTKKREINNILFYSIMFHLGVPLLLSSYLTEPTDLSGAPFPPHLGQ